MLCWLQVGSADHNIHYFDLRNPSSPLSVFRGHRKAVSYVKFLSQNELASASTDSTLRLWDVQTDCSVSDHFIVRTASTQLNNWTDWDKIADVE